MGLQKVLYLNSFDKWHFAEDFVNVVAMEWNWRE
jgi:hypothetical protein